MAATDLSAPTAVQSYLGQEGSDTELIGMLITAVSRSILSYCGRDSFLSRSYDEIYDGRGTRSLVLRHWPVTSVTQLLMYGQLVPQSTNNTVSPDIFNSFAASFMFSAWNGDPPGKLCRLDLRGGVFPRDVQNIEVKYQAGYAVSGEPQTINTTNFQVVPNQPNGRWAGDVSVVYTVSGVALTPVSSAPTVGQYVSPKLGGSAFYQFNTADQGLHVSLTYSFIPQDVELAVIMQTAELYKYRSRVGERSRSLGGQETASFMVTDLHPAVKTMLRPYYDNAKSLIG